MVKFLKYIQFTVIVLLIVFVVFSFQIYFFLNKPLNVGSQGYVLLIEPGQSWQKIAKNLEQNDILRQSALLVWWVSITGDRTKLKAGEYLVKPGTNPLFLIALLKSGKVIQHALTIVEGWNFEQVMEAIEKEPKLTHTLTGLSKEEIMVKLGYPGLDPEGLFFPETYYFTLNTPDVIFLQRAYKLLQEKLNKAWCARAQDLLLKTPYEVLILASIIEKESGFIEEYRDIAGVYIRRLQKNMPLSADPTVIYGIGKNYTGRITAEMLKMATPYNTYLKPGLPPTPIAMASFNAILAAAQPKSGDTLYFVASKTGKGHIFSRTLEEHQAAVAEYRKVHCPDSKKATLPIEKTE